MEEYLDLLKNVALFSGIDVTELEAMLKCIGANIKTARKDEILLLSGDEPRNIGIVLTGRLHIVREDYDGNRSLISAVAPGEIFAEALCCAGVSESPVTVTAGANSKVMLLSFSRILRTCTNSCAFHTRLIRNMLAIIAGKNLFYQARMEIINLKSLRAKVVRYLESENHRHGQAFTIPFNREEMADYLCVDRSALSHELSKMKKEGLIDYRKNQFTIIQCKDKGQG